jgi:hypothetical protein
MMKARLTLLTAFLSTGTALAGGGSGSVELTTIRYVVEGGGTSAILEWPLVLGAGSEDAVALMNQALSYGALTGESIEETMANYAECQRGIVGSSYVVNLNEACLLDITISIDYYGAYPSTFTHYVNLDTVTGLQLTVDDMFDFDMQDDLASLLDGMLQERISEAVEIYSEDFGVDPGMYEGYSFTVRDLGTLTIGPDGAVFHYDFGFPHVAAAAEPDGELSLDWEALGPFLAEGSPLLALAER